jgi:hypothetical protein
MKLKNEENKEGKNKRWLRRYTGWGGNEKGEGDVEIEGGKEWKMEVVFCCLSTYER